MMKPQWVALLVPALALFSGMPALHAQDFEYYTPSILQASGEDAPFLPEFSYAGYHWGERAIPSHPPTLNVTEFGAVPSDGLDDTRAILAAVEAAHGRPGTVVIRFPPGRFILREILWIERGNLVLQGSGSGEGGTVIEFPRPLWEMDFSRVREKYKWVRDWLEAGRLHERTIFAYHGGILWSRLPDGPRTRTVATVTGGERGGHELVVSATEPIHAGDVFRLVRSDPAAPGSLIAHVMGEVDIPLGSWTGITPIFEFVTVTGVDGDRVTVKEPLFHDVRPEWNTILETAPFLEEVGIEGFRFECPGRTEYRGHFTERGYNPIEFGDVRNGWIRDVAVDNADSAILTRRSCLLTYEDITVTGEFGAHYAVHLGSSERCVARNIHADMKAIHVLSFNTFTHGCVFTNCVARTGRLDQHGGLNGQNLFDDIVVREAEHGWGVFGHGGSGDKLPIHAAFNTFWNIRLIYPLETVSDIPHPLHGSIVPGAAARLVCFRANVPLRIQYYNVDAYIEGTNRVIADEYASLYKWQLARRLGESHPAVLRVKSPLELEIHPADAQVAAGTGAGINAILRNRGYRPVRLRNPDGSSASLRWSVRPLDAEAREHAQPREVEGGAEPAPPEGNCTMLAGTEKWLRDWLRPVVFPGPGMYEVALVYEGLEGPGTVLRSPGKVVRVRE